MRSLIPLAAAASVPSGLTTTVSAQQNENDIPFSACPLIGAYYPPLTIDKSSKTFAQLQARFTGVFNDLIKNGGSDDYGPISANTTSFSVVLFGGAESLRDDPVFFEYHYTSPEDQAAVKANLTSTTKFPVGDLSVVFTVYAWLVKNGDNWETPITKYLPELARVKGPLTVPWKEVTIGSLAGQMSGLSRQFVAFVSDFAKEAPVFLPDTTPVVSYAAFQLLAFAMERQTQHGRRENSWGSVLDDSLLRPLNMRSSGLLSPDDTDVFAIEGLNLSQIGEPGALSLVSSIEDLARAGHSILSSTLLSPAITRRWLHPNMDTSNLRNGVGRPWEVYRAGSTAISPVLDVLTKSGTIGQYASYFGLTADFNAGFAILAHDSTVKDRKLDLNVHADIVSESLGYMQAFAAKELAQRYAGSYEAANGGAAVLNITENGPGLEIQRLSIGKVDVKTETAKKLGIKVADLDFRIYPTNVQDKSKHQFVAVFQDRSAPIDKGTPTCITWQEVGAVAGVEDIFVFLLDKDGSVVGFELPETKVKFERAS
ncbi:uncharacterized protein NECHADRAFT_52335 [Fusarium vanettenii 77-13-4]|uniref:Uncharacterized protein n=1 Tax=Fusarium vanettenii (strain ATCC MYA-4622 / CBS 123669 / FGSC 9596 / NRRL 45880 / 77-13-4) TaxID=660122 RepID=C7ZK42_FUSV7|nr:uncharacterized protein NECHADRAFT_52335 [Fusarium vanettenii 77-13-4]EEU35573.1 hypothetical protein NECHADRAFT_52335 [Fusarium vanettenii 77-13-4]